MIRRMGVTTKTLAQWLTRHVRKTDLVLVVTCAFAAACSILAHVLSGEQTFTVPKIALRQVPVLLLPLFLWLACIVGLMIKRGYERPLRVFGRLLRRDPLWLFRAIILLIAIYGTAPAYSAFKVQIPHILPFYADTAIINIEATLFGQDPWRLTHSLFGLYGTVALDRLYLFWFPTSAFLIVWAIVTRDRVFQARAVTTMFFLWFVLGNFTALALSSSGPVYYEHFYGDDRFSPLIDTLRAYHAEVKLSTVRTSDWLISAENQGKLGSGISAMPSLHVGMTFLTWLFVQSRIGWKNPISAILVVYVALIWIASVHLAWHYCLDGLVSIVGAALFWKATGYFLQPERKVRAASLSESQPHSPEMPSGSMAVEAGRTA